MKERSKAGLYVYFAKLIQKDKVLAEEDNRVQLIMKGGGAFFVSANEGNATSINSLYKWDQAFRVFFDIYCKVNPSRSTELIQYSHVIHTAASTYIWDNIYTYDHDFRLHANPRRTWAIILQQAWAMRLKDRIKSNDYSRLNFSGGSAQKGGQHSGQKEIRKRFNRGRCTFGARCRYDHRCSYCFKFGHGLHNCRKFAADHKKDKDDHHGVQHHKTINN